MLGICVEVQVGDIGIYVANVGVGRGVEAAHVSDPCTKQDI